MLDFLQKNYILDMVLPLTHNLTLLLHYYITLSTYMCQTPHIFSFINWGHGSRTLCLLYRNSMAYFNFIYQLIFLPILMQLYCMLSRFSHVQLFATLWTTGCQVPLSMGFTRQDYWSGCHALLQGIFPTQGLNPSFLCLLHWQAGSLPLAPPEKQLYLS